MLRLGRDHRSQGAPHALTYPLPIAVGQMADNPMLGSGGQRSEKTPKNRGDPQTGLRPILQYVIHRTKCCGLARNQANNHVRSGGVIKRGGNDYCRASFDTHHTGEIKHHHVARIKQFPPPGSASPRISGRLRSGLPDLVRSMCRCGLQQLPRIASVSGLL